MVGQSIGPYTIVAKVGAGGMGEVYRAHDSKLGRDVAIKTLPRLSLDEPERRARFDREARVLASLNHPNIGAIYGLEETGGVPALVLELVEGLTLAERLAAGPMPLTEAIATARQIVDAIDTAHERGIVHRDLKPSNVKITPDDAVKVLDFGLAKLETGGKVGESSWSVGDLTHSPTQIAGTVHGVLLGTAPYMSPEQARGKPVDKRTDVWAFGCLLYEMLTGRPAFRGETTTDVLATILEREPDFTLLPPSTPPNIGRLIRRCLEKDPKRRLRDIGDARLELDEPVAAPAAASTLPAHGGSRNVVAAAVIGVAVGAALSAAWSLSRRPATEAKRDIQVQRITDFVGVEETPAMSPDGKTVAFVARSDGRRHVWVRLLSGGAPLQITRDAADHEQPRWTPDSSAIVYYSPTDVLGSQGAVSQIFRARRDASPTGTGAERR
jgi:eukaryotic-like serine/threonine-protein kinase